MTINNDTTPGWLNPVPFGDVAHGQLPGNPPQPDVLSEDQMQQIRRQLLESILSSVVQAVRGLFVPGPFGSALHQLEEWANNIPVLDTLIQAITGSVGDLQYLASWFSANVNDAIAAAGANASTALADATQALADAQQAIANALGKLDLTDFNTFLTNVFGTTTITGATQIAQDKIAGLVADFTSLFDWTVDTDVDLDELFDRWQAAFMKFGSADVTAWLNDLFSTKGVASTANANANIALVDAQQALANFQVALNKFGVGSVSAWLDDLFGTKGTADAVVTKVTYDASLIHCVVSSNDGFVAMLMPPIRDAS